MLLAERQGNVDMARRCVAYFSSISTSCFTISFSGLFLLLPILLSCSLEYERGDSVWIAGWLMHWVRVHTFIH